MNALVCQACKQNYELNDIRWRCDCGGLLDIEFDSVIDTKALVNRRASLWRYREAIPVQSDNSIVSLDEGFTPLTEINLAGRKVLIKQDQLFPSGSYKDRGSTVLVSKLKELGIKEVVEDSSGNAGASIACYCAAAGIACHVFVPESISPRKPAQIESYGARLYRVSGSRGDTARAAWEQAQTIYYASHVWNPFFFQGTKTFAYEICEQLDWRGPDSVILPVGNGTLVIGTYIGFNDLLKAGIIDKLPRIIAVQAGNCAPLYKMFKNNLNEIPLLNVSDTQAEGIAIARPARALQIIEIVRQTGGDFITVSENEISQAHQEMAHQGFYIEPTAAATIAGLKKYLKETPLNEIIVSTFTGHGLKSSK